MRKGRKKGVRVSRDTRARSSVWRVVKDARLDYRNPPVEVGILPHPLFQCLLHLRDHLERFVGEYQVTGDANDTMVCGGDSIV